MCRKWLWISSAVLALLASGCVGTGSTGANVITLVLTYVTELLQALGTI